jgi:uncharacterized protein
VTGALRAASLLLAVDFLAAGIGLAEACEPGQVPASPALVQLYFTAYDEVFSRDILPQPDGTTYISTGDIKAEWLRDSSVVGRAYVGRAKTDPSVRKVLRGVIARQAKYILLDAYANAFSVDYRVVEQKFEVDSLLYPVWLAHLYWQETGDTSVFDSQQSRAFDRILQVLRTEQHHFERSQYRNDGLRNGGRGSPVAFTGMIWTGFRPSDDPGMYGYNIPVNTFAVVVLRMLTDIERLVYHNEQRAANAWGISVQVQRGIEQHGMTTLKDAGTVYAYEVDGLGHYNLMDDANPPSILSIPYFGYLPLAEPNYQSSRRFVLSKGNPYFFTGSLAQGIGSPHTPRGYVWPLALVMQGLTSTDAAETARVLQYIAASIVSDGRLHESFDPNDPKRFTRADFAWPNALYTEFISRLQPKADLASSPAQIECFKATANQSS